MIFEKMTDRKRMNRKNVRYSLNMIEKAFLQSQSIGFILFKGKYQKSNPNSIL